MSGDNGRTPLPSSIESERGLLGAALIDGSVVRETPLAPSDFYLVRHGFIWEIMRGLSEAGGPVDYLTVMAALERAGKLVEVGVGYLTELIADTPSSANARAYAEFVASTSRMRQYVVLANDIASAAMGGEGDALPGLLDKGYDIATVGQGETLLPAKVAAGRVWDVVTDPAGHRARFVSTGLEPLDVALGNGLDVGLHILMARPAMGKTSALCQIADFVSASDRVVAFFSKEETADQIIERMACQRARVNGMALKQGRATDEQRERVKQEVERIGSRPTLLVDDSPLQTTAEIAAICARQARRRGLALVIVDHLSLLSDQAETEVLRLGKISWGLKQLAKRLRLPVVVAAQLSRAVESQTDKRPDLKDLRQSGEIEQNADTVTAIYRQKYYEPSCGHNRAEFIVRKNRFGQRNAVAEMAYLEEWTAFEKRAI